METKHTPGPWSVFEDCDKVAAHKARYPAIGTMGAYFTESITTDRGEFYNHADAVLVAAAPDLLEALKRYVDHFGDPLKCARAAIAKATGAAA